MKVWESAFFDSVWKRDRFCGRLKAGDGVVTLNGWVRALREHKGALFADLWDDSGLVQLVFPPALLKDRKIRLEDVIAVRALVRERPEGMKNRRLPTGEIEAEVKEWRTLSFSETAPFQAGAEINEDMGLKHRYLDLRFRDDLRRNLKMRSQVFKITRDYFLKQNFYEIETPVLYKSSPEGARDYIVPSRLQKGSFYALPQSPQMLKQLLMTAGMERYFQICRCFRDEDLRADRQPEFTQIDAEMSFADEEDVQRTAEGLIQKLWREILGENIQRKFPVLSYKEAMRDFGSDKPDLRNPLRLKLVRREIFSKRFPKIALRGPEGEGGGAVSEDSPASNGQGRGGDIAKALFIPFLEEGEGAVSGGVFCAKSQFSNSRLKKLNEEAKKAGCRGLLWVSAALERLAGGSGSSLVKERDAPEGQAPLVLESGAFDDEPQSEGSRGGGAPHSGPNLGGPNLGGPNLGGQNLGDAPPCGTGGGRPAAGPGAAKGLCLIGFGGEDSVNRFMSSLISRFGKEAGLQKGFAFVWIADFPFWDFSPEGGRSARHHPFTSPDREGISRLMEAGASSDFIKARAYDLVCNGQELAGGSVRNHSAAVQKKIFSQAGLSDEEIAHKFGFFLKALSLGAPPHAGIAFGLDRLLMILAGTENIRDVTAFPKSASGSCLMSGAPSPVDPALLQDLNLSSS